MVNPINPINPLKPISANATSSNGVKKGVDFKKILEDAIDKVNNTVTDAQKLSNDFATGKTSDIHSVIIAAEKADIVLQLTTEVRNKIVEAYREIMRMQI